MQTSLLDGPWIHTKDGDPSVMALYRRHYSCRTVKPKVYQFVGPGEKMVLIAPDARAVFVWRKFISDNHQFGVNCALFRNEQSCAGRSSDLITAANREAWHRWPGQRLYTYVDPARVLHKRDPGRCFLKAGYIGCGETKSGKLILELLP